MENNLKAILVNFQNDGCIMVSIMQPIMNFFKYEAPRDLYYMMGNARILSFPFISDCNSYFRNCFAYVNDVCYFSGAWDSDYITFDSDGFLIKLKEKWYEWAVMQQAMPIIVGLSSDNPTIIKFYILVGYDKKCSAFEFIDENGELVFVTENTVKEKYKLYGFATIDVPYNFLVKSRYYRGIETSGRDLVWKSGYYLSNCREMMNFFADSLKSIKNEEYEIIKTKIERLCGNLKKYRIPSDLYRNSYGRNLCKQGYYIIGEQYNKLGSNWIDIIKSSQERKEINIPLIKKTLLLEMELVKKQKG